MSPVRIFADAADIANLGISSQTDELNPVLVGDSSVLFHDEDGNNISSVGFLHLYSPYMHRYTDILLEFMKKAVDLSVPLSIILYLDGVHLCHKNQITTEFSNIEKEIDTIRQKACDCGVQMIMAACQRCSQARGYIHQNSSEIQSAPCFRNEVEISGLSSLIPYISGMGPLFSTDCADIPGEGKEVYIHMITGTPYGTEHTFGAISWAVALSGLGISSYVLFAEDGAYSCISTPESTFSGTVRDVHAVIEATSDPGILEYCVLESSLLERGIHRDLIPSDIEIIQKDGISDLKEDLIKRGYHVRMLIW